MSDTGMNSQHMSIDTVDRMRPLAKMQMEGLKINRETEAMRFGYQPRGNQR